MEYEFTLRFKVASDETELDQLVDRLGDAGCDDALVGLGMPGLVALDFIREADSAEDAILSALHDVKTALPTAQLVEASPDFVGLTDVADLLGMSRQNVRKLAITHVDSFPAPVHSGSTAIWHLSDVLLWFKDRDHKRIEETWLEVAQMTMQLNLEKEKHAIRADVRVRRGFRAALAN